MSRLTKENHKLCWLPSAGLQQLKDNTILLGQDGWADGRMGDFQHSNVSLNDSELIEDLFRAKQQGKDRLLSKMQQLADADASALKKDLLIAIKHNPKKIIVLTHIPPFQEACRYLGEPTNDDWLPYFSSKATGDVLLKVASLNPGIEFEVLCGHTHCEAVCHPLQNLHVKAGRAVYHYPAVQDEILLEPCMKDLKM